MTGCQPRPQPNPRTPAAATGVDAGIPFRERDFEAPYRQRIADADQLAGVATRRSGAHGEFPLRQPDELRAIAAVAEYSSDAKRPGRTHFLPQRGRCGGKPGTHLLRCRLPGGRRTRGSLLAAPPCQLPGRGLVRSFLRQRRGPPIVAVACLPLLLSPPSLSDRSTPAAFSPSGGCRLAGGLRSRSRCFRLPGVAAVPPRHARPPRTPALFRFRTLTLFRFRTAALGSASAGSAAWAGCRVVPPSSPQRTAGLRSSPSVDRSPIAFRRAPWQADRQPAKHREQRRRVIAARPTLPGLQCAARPSAWREPWPAHSARTHRPGCRSSWPWTSASQTCASEPPAARPRAILAFLPKMNRGHRSTAAATRAAHLRFTTGGVPTAPVPTMRLDRPAGSWAAAVARSWRRSGPP